MQDTLCFEDDLGFNKTYWDEIVFNIKISTADMALI